MLILGDNDDVLEVFVGLHEIEPLTHHLIIKWMFPLINFVTRHE